MSDDETRGDRDLFLHIEGGDERAMTGLFTRHREATAADDPEMHSIARCRDPRRLLRTSWRMPTSRLRDRLVNMSMAPDMLPFAWLRVLTLQALQAGSENTSGPFTPVVLAGVPLPHLRNAPSKRGPPPSMLLGQLTPPDRAALSAEMLLRIEEALNTIRPVDLEILALRHVQELNKSQAAQVLGVTKTTTNNRYMRAQGRLRGILREIPGLLDELGRFDAAAREIPEPRRERDENHDEQPLHTCPRPAIERNSQGNPRPPRRLESGSRPPRVRSQSHRARERSDHAQRPDPLRP